MGYYKYMRQLWQQPNEEMEAELKKHLIEWRTQSATQRIERPTRLDRARSLGYRAKEGYVIVRQRILRGGRMREKPRGGRRPKHNRRLKILNMNYQHVAEIRAAESYPNCEVLNSYFVGKDGSNYWYEIIMVDKSHPAILADKRIKWIAESQHRRRVYRGLTSSARRSRGLLAKGTGAEKVRQHN
jgi:large subunit ribosomal protein L15e